MSVKIVLDRYAPITYRRLTPIIRLIHTPRNTLQPHLLIELIHRLRLAREPWAAATMCVFFANSDVDEVVRASVRELRDGFGICVAFVHLASTILVIVYSDLKVRDGTAGIEVRDVGLGVEVLLRDVAVVGCLYPDAVRY